MLWKRSLEYVGGFFVHVFAHSCKERGTFYLAFLKSVFRWKSKSSLPSRLTQSNLALSPFKISVLEMLHICISTGVLQLVKQQHFPEFATKWFVKNQWKIFSNAPCRFLAHFLYLKSMCIEFCHLHIQQRQSLLVFQKTCQIHCAVSSPLQSWITSQIVWFLYKVKNSLS